MSRNERLALSRVQGRSASAERKPSPHGIPYPCFSPSSRGGRRSKLPSRPTQEPARRERKFPPSGPQRRSANASLRRPPTEDVLLPQLRHRVLLKPGME